MSAPAFHDGIHAGHLDPAEHDRDASVLEHGVEQGEELAVAVPDQEPCPAAAILQIHDEVPGSLDDPRCGGMSGRAEDPDPASGIPLGDILDDSGYAHRDAAAWAVPLRAAGAQLVQDLHPHDRGPRGTHEGAVVSNGNLYCPRTPRRLLELGPLARTATKDQAADHDRKTAELARYKLGRLTSDD